MYFSNALVVLSIALSAVASPHMARGINHRAVAHRAPIPVAAPEPVAVAPKMMKKRASTNRCKARSSTSSSVAPTTTHVSSSSVSTVRPSTTAVHTSSAIIPPQNVESNPPTTSAAPETTKAAEPTTTKAAPTSVAPPKPTSSAQPTTSASSGSSGGSSNDPDGILTGPHSGDGTYYGTGLGSCGITNSDTDFIVAVSHDLYDNYPGYTGGNPNNNPVCGRMIKANYQGKSVEVKVVDRCTGCSIWSLDFSPSAFSQLADQSIGRLTDVEWDWA